MNDVYEFLFCPVHGIFSARNWPTLAPIMASGVSYVLLCWRMKR
jgi:hypothetical protein